MGETGSAECRLWAFVGLPFHFNFVVFAIYMLPESVAARIVI